MTAKVKFGSVHQIAMGIPRKYKQICMLLADSVMLLLALWCAYALRISEFYPEDYIEPAAGLFGFLIVGGLPILVRVGLYRAVIRYLSSDAILAVVKGVSIIVLCLYVVAWLLNVQPFPRSVPIIFFFIAVAYVGGSRILIRSYYYWLLGRYVQRKPLAIYGADSVGAQLARSMMVSEEFMPVVFIDDDPLLQGTTISGLEVVSSNNLQALIQQLKIEAILILSQSITEKRRAEIFKLVARVPIKVKLAQSIAEILDASYQPAIRDVELDELLGRDAVPPRLELLSRTVRGKVVIVSGGGGSIGAELSRQVASLHPKKLILVDVSEFALYSIHRSLMFNDSTQTEVIPILGSVCDEGLMRRIMSHFSVQTVFHAAAYKHVPMVEMNGLQGLQNNVIGTYVIAKVARDCEVERFVMISTDKAVRPTNLMGATKRFAELTIQALANRPSNTIFSIVRFGNVLGSSGSVIPLFKEQIRNGGPVTVTHPEMTRYFMTISEAVTLVIQAGAMATGGEVFVLDMGQPLKILELAKSLVGLSGKVPFVAGEGEGDVEIQFTGIRPGEKLFEEMLIGDDVYETGHPMIMSAREEFIPMDDLELLLNEAIEVISAGNASRVPEFLHSIVSGYNPGNGSIDWACKNHDFS